MGRSKGKKESCGALPQTVFSEKRKSREDGLFPPPEGRKRVYYKEGRKKPAIPLHFHIYLSGGGKDQRRKGMAPVMLERIRGMGKREGESSEEERPPFRRFIGKKRKRRGAREKTPPPRLHGRKGGEGVLHLVVDLPYRGGGGAKGETDSSTVP